MIICVCVMQTKYMIPVNVCNQYEAMSVEFLCTLGMVFSIAPRLVQLPCFKGQLLIFDADAYWKLIQHSKVTPEKQNLSVVK